MTRRRDFMLSLPALLAGSLLCPAGSAQAGDEELPLIRLNLPGPGSLPFMPLELIPALGFDREAGARLLLRYHQSGIRALEDVLAGNADFVALGFPTLPVLQSRGKDMVAIAPIAGTRHTFHVMVRKDLAGRITRIEHLRHSTIGISTGSPSSKTYLQMLTEILLSAHQVGAHEVRWLPTGQNWEGISGALSSRAADATLCEQPFPARLVKEGIAYSLADLDDPRIRRKVAGIDALRSCIAAPRKPLDQPAYQHKAEQMVRMLKRSLAWLQGTPPETVVRHAGSHSPAEQAEIAMLLHKYPGIYSPDARFVMSHVTATDAFLRAAHLDATLPPAASVVFDRWAGTKI